MWPQPCAPSLPSSGGGGNRGPRAGLGGPRALGRAGGPRTGGSHCSHPHREAPPSPSFAAGGGQHGPTCVAHRPAGAPLPVQAASKQTVNFAPSRPSRPPFRQPPPPAARCPRSASPQETPSVLPLSPQRGGGPRRDLERGRRAAAKVAWPWPAGCGLPAASAASGPGSRERSGVRRRAAACREPPRRPARKETLRRGL